MEFFNNLLEHFHRSYIAPEGGVRARRKACPDAAPRRVRNNFQSKFLAGVNQGCQAGNNAVMLSRAKHLLLFVYGSDKQILRWRSE